MTSFQNSSFQQAQNKVLEPIDKCSHSYNIDDSLEIVTGEDQGKLAAYFRFGFK